ncbi:head GIN domain-containing protein [uncultured Microscilla sp.]|uniref:head GIN domain-containing protein n=1 Tax=uncultured Microscilla sp. TaxID=432653 RepID=UPI0026042439|nr:head GIN domain-containing protein [uncultured Microscilla sp.]
MTRILYSLTLLFALVISAQAQQTSTRNLSSFTKLKVSGAASIVLKQGTSHSAKVTLQGDIENEEIITRVKNNTLYVSLKKRKHSKYNNINVKIELTFQQLNAIDLSGAVSIRGESTIKAERFYLENSGAGSLQLAFNTQHLICNLSGASSIRLKGTTNRLDVDLSGAGSINAYGLVANIIKSESSGAGSIKINAQKELYASVSGVGSIRYKGNPAITRFNKSGFGSIRKTK